MLLHELIHGTPLRLVSGRADVSLTDLTDDSRGATPGCAFIARAGTKADGGKYIADAIAKGAVAIIAEPVSQTPNPKSQIATVWAPAGTLTNEFVGRLAERFFDSPSRRLKLVAITGTKGKTTTAFVIQHLLASAGLKCGMIGTVVIDDGKRRVPAELTTPGAIDFSRYMAAMAANGCAAVVAEVSSHALHQGRVAALSFDVGVFTNLTGDHLDYHQTMDNYADAKAILFEGLLPGAWAVVNGDDAYVHRMTQRCSARVVECTLGREGPGSGVWGLGRNPESGSSPQTPDLRPQTRLACRGTILELGASFSRVRMQGPWGDVEVRLPLVGRHNVINALEAVAAANCVVDLSRVLRGSLETCPAVPGRLEPVIISDLGSEIDGAATQRVAGPSEKTGEPLARGSSANPQSAIRNPQSLPAVVVDYAHTHDAMEKVLDALRPLVGPGGRLICLFGCGGDRDRTKRPKMARVACERADVVVVTSDNPRTEKPGAIIEEILKGVPEGFAICDLRFAIEETAAVASGKIANRKSQIANVYVQPDRAAAIRMAIDLAEPGDLVLLAGKGHEDYQIIGTTKRHFDDREHAAEALRQWRDRQSEARNQDDQTRMTIQCSDDR